MDTTTLIKATLSITPTGDRPALVGSPWIYPLASLEYEIKKGLRYGDVAVEVEWIALVPKEAA